MIAVERIQETVYVFRLSERAMDEAIDDASALQAQLRAARSAYANPITAPANGNGPHEPGIEATTPKKSRPHVKRGGAKAKKQKTTKPRLQCPHCTMSFSRPKNLANHVRYLHPTEVDLANG